MSFLFVRLSRIIFKQLLWQIRITLLIVKESVILVITFIYFLSHVFLSLISQNRIALRDTQRKLVHVENTRRILQSLGSKAPLNVTNIRIRLKQQCFNFEGNLNKLV